METNTVAVSLLSGLVGTVLGSLGTLLAVYLNSRLKKNRYRLRWKRDVLARLVGNRHFLTVKWKGRSSGEPFIALNQAFVAFDASLPVLDALKKYHAELDLPGPDRNENNLVTLIKAMAKSSGVRVDGLNDFFVTHLFTPPSPEGLGDEMKMRHRNPGVMALIVIQHERAQQETDLDVRSHLMRSVQELQGMLGGTEAEECIRELTEIVRTAFLVKSCPRCHENKMALIEVSPNARSIEYACTYCGRRQRAAANNPDAQRVKWLERFIVAVLGKAWFRTVMDGYRCTFSTPEAMLPYERPTRELIPHAIRGQVWRRDNGRCVQCGSRENLQFDHIIPVSEGGATTAHNLQLLCQSCNLSKGAKI